MLAKPGKKFFSKIGKGLWLKKRFHGALTVGQNTRLDKAKERLNNRYMQKETNRLFARLRHVGWSQNDCALIAPMTLEINALKKQKKAVILAHTYQTPDIVYGVADVVGDSYGLSIAAQSTTAETIVFSSVHFMAETAKLLNPKKKVLVPAVAGCSLAESITPQDVRNLRQKHPGAPVVCYVNTSAAVKAESDVCCTSSNALKIVESLPGQEVIFIPDEFMAKNLQALTKKKIIGWQGRCVVHETFSPEAVDEIRRNHPGVRILAHTECSPAVVKKVDMAGGTEAMIRYVQTTRAESFMVVTECGLADRLRAEMPQKKVVGACALCPYMKKIMLKDILKVLRAPKPENIIRLPESTAKKARRTLERMIEITEAPSNNHARPQANLTLVKHGKLPGGNALNGRLQKNTALIF